MMKRAAIVLLLLLVFAPLALADEPPSWQEFEVKSANGRFIAEELWLSDEPSRVEFSGSESRPLVLQILTIDKKLHRIDIATGQLLK
jgi:hypothetical protein